MFKNNFSMSFHEEKKSAMIKKLAAEFLELTGNQSSLITVSGCYLSKDSKKADIMITVLPEEKEKAALQFAQRHGGELRKYVMEKSRMGFVPKLEIKLDEGEKNRQRIEALLLEDKKK